MVMEWYHIVLLVVAGVVVGFINTLAGSGSLISLPLLIFLGLPANVANGTNRVAILMQTVVSTSSFYKGRKLLPRSDARVAIPAGIGAIAGALLAVDTRPELLERIIGIVLILMLILIILKPKRFLEQHEPTVKNPVLNFIVFLGIGFYGGFIQAGVGIFILMGLALSAGYDLVRANAVKNLIVLLYTPLALLIFALSGQVNWYAGLVLAAGNMIGAWLASRAAMKHGAGFVRWLLIVVIVASAAKLLFW